ncbi:GreA/GreB family elongation factor [Novosphingobium guangzhouense]|uniref:Nucleoside-diphosphate kinase n=1 Tax=Novosphingobium guangzhouense TaxID=1850347 RepID=A0A2K2G1I4_9SPHN|nr:GreA/GreB family elongation factor [Novosphingobium guangzhouense]PNU04905.1 nucleoside-diphosphate kinase [Novosphingobium guangzhouense]
MSVAFRRDGDEEHLEPKFEVPIPPGPNLVTVRGRELILEKVSQLEAQVAALTEETALTGAKRDLRYWQARLDTAQVQPIPEDSTVRFGSRVRFMLGNKLREIVIVGHDEADPAQDRLAFVAPLAKALLGAEVGDFVDFNGREEAIEVLEIGAP